MSRPKNLKYSHRMLFADDKEKLNLDRVIGAITGEKDPLRFPISYPAIDFDPATKKMFINGCLIIATGIVLSGAVRGALSR